MADIALPADLPMPAEVDFGLRAHGRVFRSPETGAVRSVSMPGAYWVMTLRWTMAMTPLESGIIEGLIARLDGQANRLVSHRIAKPAPLGSALGSPVVSGAGQTGTALTVSGFPASANNLLLPGDMIGVNGELKMVVLAVNSNASGVATINFAPALRASPPNGAAIVMNKPTTRWVLAQPAAAWTHARLNVVKNHTLELMESFT